MSSSENPLPYILTGCIFYVFGLKWCGEYAKFWYTITNQRSQRDVTKDGLLGRIQKSINDVMSNHPFEGCLKLIATAIGLAGTLAGGLTNSGVISAKVVHATIYVFFAFSGLVDVLHFYFPRSITDGFAKMALAQSFFIEGFLFVWGGISDSSMINTILAAIVWMSTLAVTLELLWPEVKLLRGMTTLLQGGWIAHMVRLYRTEPLSLEKVALTFSWHIAVATMVTLVVVTVTRSCISRSQPEVRPELPIYDYCHEMEIRP